MDAITTGDYNTALGYGDYDQRGPQDDNNVAVGYEALRDNSSTSNNVAIGLSALQESNAIRQCCNRSKCYARNNSKCKLQEVKRCNWFDHL